MKRDVTTWTNNEENANACIYNGKIVNPWIDKDISKGNFKSSTNIKIRLTIDSNFRDQTFHSVSLSLSLSQMKPQTTDKSHKDQRMI